MQKLFWAAAIGCLVVGCAGAPDPDSGQLPDCGPAYKVVGTGERCDGVTIACEEGGYCDLYGGSAVCLEQKEAGAECDAAFECLSRTCDGHCSE